MRINEILNIVENGSMPTVHISDLFHVGSLDASSKRQGSYEGAGLSVSTHPDEWKQIARGHVTGNTYSATKEGHSFLNAHALNKKQNNEIAQWAMANDYLVQQETVTVSWFDDDMGETMSRTFDSMEDARVEHAYDGDMDHVDVVVDKSGIIPTDKLKSETNNSDMESTGVLEYVLPLYAGKLNLDGVWWQDRVDVQSYSAPRGVILPHKVDSWKFTIQQ